MVSETSPVRATGGPAGAESGSTVDVTPASAATAGEAPPVGGGAA